MKTIFVIFVIFLIGRISHAADNTPEIVLYETDGDDTHYNFQFETSDGIARVEKGELKEDSDPEGGLLSVEGAYTYTDDKGVEHKVSYKADEKGYRVLPGST